MIFELIVVVVVFCFSLDFGTEKKEKREMCTGQEENTHTDKHTLFDDEMVTVAPLASVTHTSNNPGVSNHGLLN